METDGIYISINVETVMLQSTLIAGVMYLKSLRMQLQSTIIDDLKQRRLGVVLQRKGSGHERRSIA